MATKDLPNLYQRLGGVYSIATVVDDLIDRVMVDPRLNANPLVDYAHHKVPPAGFKYLVTEMLCWAAGGPQKYTGKDMESSHRHLRITPGEWDAFRTTWHRRSTSSAVPAAERAEVVAIVESPRRSYRRRHQEEAARRTSCEDKHGRIGGVETIRYPVKSMAARTWRRPSSALRG